MKTILLLLPFFLVLCLLPSGCNKMDDTNVPTSQIQTPEMRFKQFGCDDSSSIPVGPSLEYTLLNNTWGRCVYEHGQIRDCMKGYKQCISYENLISTWNWRWLNPGGLFEGRVKGYPEIVFGKSPWGASSNTVLLPERLQNIAQIEVSYSAQVSLRGPSNRLNLSFDSWVCNVRNPDTLNIVCELMIWEYRANMAAAGELLGYRGSVFVSGIWYNLYEETRLARWPIYSYVAQSPVPISNRTIQIYPFLRDLVEKNVITMEHYLSTVEFGNEIVEGSGETRIPYYGITILTNYLNQFSDNFDDGDFTNNPTWNLTPGGTGCWAPGTREVVNGEFHVKDMDSPGCGHATMIESNLNMEVTDQTKVKFDLNPVYSDVRNGDGDAHYEYPAIVMLDLYDSGNKLLSLWFCYNYRGGVSTTTDTLIRVSFPYVPKNTWQRNQSFRVKDYFPNAVRIGKIYVGAMGWDYEAYFDNISVGSQ